MSVQHQASSANLGRKKEWKYHPEGIKIGRMDAAADHKSAQKGGKHKRGATGEILNLPKQMLASSDQLGCLSMIFTMKEWLSKQSWVS